MPDPISSTAANGPVLDCVEVGLRLAPMIGAAPVAARDVIEELGTDFPAKRLIGLGTDGSRVLITLAIALGTPEQVRSGAEESKDAVVYMHDLVKRLSYADPAMIAFPEGGSIEAVIATHVETQAQAYGLGPQVDEIRAKALDQAIKALAGIGVAVGR